MVIKIMDGSIKLKCTELGDEALENFINKETFTDRYSIEEDIASGHFATVKKCRDKKTNQEYAAKFVRKRRRGKTIRPAILNEIRIHKMISNHPRIISLHECYETPSEIIMILEYAKAGELFRSLEDDLEDQECMDECLVARLIYQVLESLAYLHEFNIVHLDIKPSNILLTEPLPHGDIKLCDFGLSRIMNSRVETREMIGTPDYVAPEVLNYDALSTQTDMWSLGVLTYVMLTGHSPFSCTKNGHEGEDSSDSEDVDGLESEGNDVQETYLNITMGNLDFPSELFDTISREAVDFISKLCVVHPKKRLTTAQCFAHPWIKENLGRGADIKHSIQNFDAKSSRQNDNIFIMSSSSSSNEELLTPTNDSISLTTQNPISLIIPNPTSKSSPSERDLVLGPEVGITPNAITCTIVETNNSFKCRENRSSLKAPQNLNISSLNGHSKIPTIQSFKKIEQGPSRVESVVKRNSFAKHDTQPKCSNCSLHCGNGNGAQDKVKLKDSIEQVEGSSNFVTTYYKTKIPNLKAATISLRADSDDWKVANADGSCQLSFHSDKTIMSINIQTLDENVHDDAGSSPDPGNNCTERNTAGQQDSCETSPHYEKVKEVESYDENWEHQSFHESTNPESLKFRARCTSLASYPAATRSQDSEKLKNKVLSKNGAQNGTMAKDTNGGQKKSLKSPQCLINGKLYKQKILKDKPKVLGDLKSMLTIAPSRVKQNQQSKEPNSKVGKLEATSPSNWLRGRA